MNFEFSIICCVTITWALYKKCYRGEREKKILTTAPQANLNFNTQFHSIFSKCITILITTLRIKFIQCAITDVNATKWNTPFYAQVKFQQNILVTNIYDKHAIWPRQYPTHNLK